MAQTHPRDVRRGIAERVRDLAEEVLQNTPHFLVDVEVRGHHGTRVVEVYVDSGEGDPGLDDIAAVSKELDFLMEMEETVDGSYKLEVSSPGLDRPLTDPRQFKKNAGRGVRVKYTRAGSKEKVEGDLTDATGAAIEVTEGSGDTRRIAYDDIQEAKLKLPW